MSPQPWYETFFGNDYLRLYHPHLTPERTQAEVLGILRCLCIAPGSKILDVCCGHGRHSIPLAALGYQVTGLDLSLPFLRRARLAARAVGARVRWTHADMRQIPFHDEFDAAINIFTAFGYLEDEEQDRLALEQVRGALLPGGQFLIEIASRDALVRHWLPQEVERHEDGLLSILEQEFDQLSGRLQVRVTLIEPDGTRREHRYTLRVYTLTELAGLLEAAGLRVEACYGDLDANPLTLDSRRLVVVARRPI